MTAAGRERRGVASDLVAEGTRPCGRHVGDGRCRLRVFRAVIQKDLWPRT